jgi:hypothetical protein
MNRRLAVMTVALVASGLVVPGVGATAAFAKAKAKPAPKPVCLMLTDQRGDAKIQGQGNNYAVDDIVSADIATGKKTIVGVLRLASGDSASGIPTGATYVLRWTQTQKGSDGKTSTMRAAFFFYVYATGGTSGGFGTSTDPSFDASDQSSETGSVPFPQASMDSNGVITWVMKRKDASVVTGAKFTQLSATSSIADNFQIATGALRGSSQTLDDATGHASYADMQQSCVRAS